MGFSKATTGPTEGTEESIESLLLPTEPEVTAKTKKLVPSNTLSDKLSVVKRGHYNIYAAQKLGAMAGWSYSDFDTFKDIVGDYVGSNIETIMIQVKNEPLLVQATAQMIRTSDKKVAIVTFRGTEMTNLVNWMTDAVAKKSDFHNIKRAPVDNPDSLIQVHTGFKENFDKVWFGQKGILMHLLFPEMMRKDYDYNKTRAEQGIPSEQDDLEAIYICGHSLGGAMAALGGLYLAAKAEKTGPNPFTTLFDKLRGVYTYGGPMVVDDHDRARCQSLCGSITFRHVFYNDIVPHLPPLSTGSFDHFGSEYRYHPQEGWKKRSSAGIGFKSDRCTQVISIAATAPLGALDGILDNINWLAFFRGEDRDWPIIGIFSRPYLKMPWSLHDHGPVGYITTLEKLKENESLGD